MSIARFNPPAFSRSALAAQIAFDGIARRLGLLAKVPKLADFQSAGAAASTHQLQLVVIELFQAFSRSSSDDAMGSSR